MNNIMENTEEVPVGQLAEYARNPRRGDTAAITESLETLGQYRPIVVNRGTHTGIPGEILAGNHTYRSAQAMGWETIRVVWVDVDAETGLRIMLADNRTSDLATYDTDALMALLRDLPDTAGTGYEMGDIPAIKPPETEVKQSNKSQEGVNLFSQKGDWEERATRGMMLDYSLDDYWQVRDLFDAAAGKAGTKTPAETLLYIIEKATGEAAPK